jgi:hypothetical protein
MEKLLQFERVGMRRENKGNIHAVADSVVLCCVASIRLLKNEGPHQLVVRRKGCLYALPCG